MKTVYLIRHAKSSWDDLTLPDKERPLNERGLRDAPFMGMQLRAKAARIDRLITSPAKRALVTATYFAVALGLPAEQILIEPGIYESQPDDIIDILRTLSDNYTTVALFGHNPTLTALTNLFGGLEEKLDNLPTCGIIRIDADVNHWIDFKEDMGFITEFHYPKQFFK
jgi:phosphohistidine phosphatase